jgi:RND family efflux transporter MFP subunit
VKKNVKRQSVRIAAVMLGAMLVTAGCNKPEEAAKTISEIPVAVTDITGGSLNDNTLITGTIKPGKDVELMPTNPGELVSVSVKKGDTVTKGQVLAKLDTSDYELGLKQAQASLSRAKNGEERVKSTLNRAKNGQARAQETYKQAQGAAKLAEDGLRQAEISLRQAEANMAQAKNGRTDGMEGASYNLENAKNQWEDAKRNLARVQGLFEEGLTSQQQLDQAKTAEMQANIAYQQAQLSEKQASREDNLAVLQTSIEQAKVGIDRAKKAIEDAETNENLAAIGMKEADIAAEEAAVAVQDAAIAVKEAQIGVEQAQKKIDDMIIKAPVAGEVLDVMAETGEFVSNQTPFARLVSADVLHLEALVTPEQMFTLEEGDSAEVNIPSLKTAVNGTVTYISPTAEQSGLFKVEIQLPNENRQIRPGMVAQLNLKEVLVADSFLVPTEAVVEKDDKAYIFVIAKGKAVQKEVEVVRAETDFTAINGSVSKGEKVVVKGQNLLKDGDQTRIMKEEK